MTVKVSVIIPVYNTEKYLPECLQSLMDQTLKDIEIICVDDGSTDQSVEVIKKYQQLDSRIILLQQENKYAGVARNYGMTVAKGDYLVFLDSDDFFDKNLLEEELYKIEKYDADICLCNADQYDTQASKFVPMPWAFKRNLFSHELASPEQVGRYLFQVTSPCPWTKMFSHKFVLENKLQFQPLQRANDLCFVFSALGLAKRITYVNDILVHYRINNKESLQNNNYKTPTAFITALNGVWENLNIKDADLNLKRSFANAALSNCAYNLRTLEKTNVGNTFSETKLFIKNKYSDYFELNNHSRDYFYNKGDFDYLYKLGVITKAFNNWDTIKVSVIISLYNAENCLDRTLESVLRQSLEDIEILCVNDGSFDRTYELLQNYAKKDRRIRIINHTSHLGNTVSVKDGVSISLGDYVMFLSGGDEISPDACQIAYESINNSNVDILQFSSKIIEDNANQQNYSGMRSIKNDPQYKTARNVNVIEQCWVNKKINSSLWDKIVNGNLGRAVYNLDDKYFTSVESDAFPFFVMCYYASSYRVIGDLLYSKCIKSNKDISGIMNLKQFEEKLSLINVVDSIKKFIKCFDDEEDILPLIPAITEELLQDAYYQWNHNFNSDDQKAGFSRMISMWGSDAVLPLLLNDYWGNEKALSDKISGARTTNANVWTLNSPKTIVVYYFSVSGYGPEQTTLVMANRLALLKDKNGKPLFHIVLITDEQSSEVNEGQINPLIERAYVPGFVHHTRKNYLVRYEAWQKIIADYQVDMVISGLWMNSATFWDALSVKFSKLHPAFVMIAHGFCCTALQSLTITGNQLLANFSICDGVVTISKADKIFASAFNPMTTCIYEPISNHEPLTSSVNTHGNKIYWMGRIIQENNPIDTIMIMEDVVKSLPEAKLIIVGSGEPSLINSMKAEISHRNLDKNIEIINSDKDIDECCLDAGILIETAQFRSAFSTSAPIFLWHGIPVISYDAPWMDLYRFGKGIQVVEPGDYKAVGKAIVDLVSHPEKLKSLGGQGQKWIRGIDSNYESRWSDFISCVLKEVGENGDECLSKNLNFRVDLENIIAFGDKGIATKLLIERANCEKRNNQDIQNKNLKLMKLKQSYNAILNSRSLRVGKIITFIPRKLRNMLINK